MWDDMPPPDDAPAFEWFLYFLSVEKSRLLIFNKLRHGKEFSSRQLYKELGDSKSQRDIFVKRCSKLGLLQYRKKDPDKGQMTRIYFATQKLKNIVDMMLIIKKRMLEDNSNLGEPPVDDPEYQDFILKSGWDEHFR